MQDAEVKEKTTQIRLTASSELPKGSYEPKRNI